MITFAGPASRPTPNMPPTASGMRRRKNGLRASLIVIDYLPNCENVCWQILPDAADGCQDGTMTGMAQVRPYRGIEAAERLNERRRRLVEAGLDLLGADNSETELTVRAVCKKAGLTARYFYESFADKDQFVVAVFDDAVAGI